MAHGMNENPIYTVKFLNENGLPVLEDFNARSTSYAQDAWEAKYRDIRENITLVNIFRKS